MLLLAIVSFIKFNILLIYTSVRWPALYTQYDLAHKWKARTEELIHEALKSMKNEIPEKKGSKRKKILEKAQVESFSQTVAPV